MQTSQTPTYGFLTIWKFSRHFLLACFGQLFAGVKKVLFSEIAARVRDGVTSSTYYGIRDETFKDVCMGLGVCEDGI